MITLNGEAKITNFGRALVLFNLAEGRLPFKGETPQATMMLVVSGELPALTRGQGPAKRELQRILRKALAKEPAERYQHVDDFIVDMRAVLPPPGITSGFSRIPPPSCRTKRP